MCSKIFRAQRRPIRRTGRADIGVHARTNSDHTKVFVDGIDVNDPSSPNASFDFGQFLTQDIAKVEVLRGPQSGLYGSDAIGGVINIITKSGSGREFVARVEGGSFATFNQSAAWQGRPMDFITRRISNTFIRARLR